MFVTLSGISYGWERAALRLAFTDAVRELQVLKEDELWEHRLVSHISFSFSILSLQHSSEFRFLKSSPCLEVSFSRFPFFVKYLCISAPLHATLFLHLAAVVLSLILLKGLVLVVLLSFRFRLLFPSLNMVSHFLTSHLAFSSSPPIMCYCVSWIWKCISLIRGVLICNPSTVSQQALLV